MKKLRIGLVAALLMSAGNTYADGLDSLIELGRGQAEIQKAYSKETGAYEAVKRGAENCAITKGQRKEDIERRYGEPVIILRDADGVREKWVYKPAKASFFDGVKISLFFDKNGALDEIKADAPKESR